MNEQPVVGYSPLSFTPAMLAAALARRGKPTSGRGAWAILVALEARGVVERVEGSGAWRLTPAALEAIRSGVPTSTPDRVEPEGGAA